MMQVVPTQPLPNQTLQSQLGGQACTINVYQQAYGLYIDLLVNNVPVIMGVLAHNLNRTVRSLYLGFIGDLTFVDTQGTDDPVYTGLGDRFVLLYLTAAEAGDG